MLGSPNRLVHHIFEFSCLPILAHIFMLQFQPVSEGRKIQKYDELADLVTRAWVLKKNIFAAEKTFKTPAFFSNFRKDLERKNK